jgi:hypothetical protein
MFSSVNLRFAIRGLPIPALVNRVIGIPQRPLVNLFLKEQHRGALADRRENATPLKTAGF